MKILFFIASACFMSFTGYLQPNDSFSVLMHKKILLKDANPVNNNGPVVTVKRSLLKKKGVFAIQYKQATRNPGWERIFQFTDAANTIQLQKGFPFAEGTYGFNTTELLPLLEKNKKMLLYTYQQPSDPLLAGIRVERYLLCELVLE